MAGERTLTVFDEAGNPEIIQGTVRSSRVSSSTGVTEKKDEINLEKTHKNYDILSPKWNVLSDCYKGGGAIENADDDVYLVKNESEVQKKYNVRKRLAVYYNKPAQVITTFQGHLWRKEPLRELPEDLKQYLDNVDRNGRSANSFFSYVTKWAQVLGIFYVLVEYPENPEANKKTKSQTKSQEKNLGLRPYFTWVHPTNILDWDFYIDETGVRRLKYVVIREEKIVNKEPFKETEFQAQYRVIYPNKFEYWTYIENSNGQEEAIMIDEKVNTLGVIPLVPFYSEEMEYGVGKSAISDITNLSLELFNKHSQRTYAELMSAFPVLILAGWDENTDITVSEDAGIKNIDPSAKAYYLESSGGSLDSLRTAEKDIIMEMFDIAMKQVRNTSNQRETAEAKKMDRLDALSDLQARAVGFSTSEKLCWIYAYMWMGNKNINKIDINYNLDYDIDKLKADLINVLLNMRTTNDLSQDTLWDILKKGEILPDDFDPEKEKDLIDEEIRNSLPVNKPPIIDESGKTGDEEDDETDINKDKDKNKEINE